MAAYEPAQLGPEFFFFLNGYLQENILGNVWDKDGNAKDPMLYKILIKGRDLNATEMNNLLNESSYFADTKTILDSSVNYKKASFYGEVFWKTFIGTMKSQLSLLQTDRFREYYLPEDPEENSYDPIRRKHIGKLALQVMMNIHQADVEKMNELQRNSVDPEERKKAESLEPHVKNREVMLVRSNEPGAPYKLVKRKELEEKQTDDLYSSFAGEEKGEVFYSPLNIGLIRRLISQDIRSLAQLGQYQEGMTKQELLQNNYQLRANDVIKQLREQGFSPEEDITVGVDGMARGVVIDSKGNRVQIEFSVAQSNPNDQINIRMEIVSRTSVPTQKFNTNVDELKKKKKPVSAVELAREKQAKKAAEKARMAGSKIGPKPRAEGLGPQLEGKGVKDRRAALGAGAGITGTVPKGGMKSTLKPGRGVEGELQAKRKVAEEGKKEQPKVAEIGVEKKEKGRVQENIQAKPKERPKFLAAVREGLGAERPVAASTQPAAKGRMSKVVKGMLYGGLAGSIAIPAAVAGGTSLIPGLFA